MQVVSLFPITFLLLSFLLPVLSLFPFQKPESMQSTLVGGSAAGRLQGAKATLYVGGLSDNVNEAALHAAFIPFGEIKVCEEKSTPEKKKKKKKTWGDRRPFFFAFVGFFRTDNLRVEAKNAPRPRQWAWIELGDQKGSRTNAFF